jgi:hypothetical protein
MVGGRIEECLVNEDKAHKEGKRRKQDRTLLATLRLRNKISKQRNFSHGHGEAKDKELATYQAGKTPRY